MKRGYTNWNYQNTMQTYTSKIYSAQHELSMAITEDAGNSTAVVSCYQINILLNWTEWVNSKHAHAQIQPKKKEIRTVTFWDCIKTPSISYWMCWLSVCIFCFMSCLSVTSKFIKQYFIFCEFGSVWFAKQLDFSFRTFQFYCLK